MLSWFFIVGVAYSWCAYEVMYVCVYMSYSRAALPKSTSPGAHRWGPHVRVERVAEHGHERPRLVEVEHGHEIALYMLRNGGAEKSSSGLIES